MRIIVTSDIHYQSRIQPVVWQFIEDIAALEPDCLVVAGDVAESPIDFEIMLKQLIQVDCPRLILAGNHDLWATASASSDDLFMRDLPKLVHDHGAIWLEDENWIADGIGICGSIGWYDYTGADPGMHFDASHYFREKQRFMADGDRIDWAWTDIDFAERIGNLFSMRLAALDHNPEVNDIFVITHVPPFAEAIIRKPGNVHWNFTNAYFYNLTFGKRIRVSPKVKRVLSGHIHCGKTVVIADSLIQLDIIPADYGQPGYVIIDL